MPLISQDKTTGLSHDDWRFRSAQDLLGILAQPTSFPCFFSQNACKRQLIQFSFVDENTPAAHGQALQDILSYVAKARAWDGDVATAEPLVMQFNPATHARDTVDGYHDLGWSILQFWHENDPAEWPQDVGHDPNHPFWSMCLGGMQLFVNMSCPAHRIRKSRNLGQALTFVINPRERFDIVAGDNPRGHRIREQIRNGIVAYDGIHHCPTLGSFQAGEIEWWQYGLPEENALPDSGCPFRMRDQRPAEKQLGR